MPSLANVPGIKNTSKKFREKVVEIADRIKVDANFLMAIMSFETGGSFDPAQKSLAGSGARGLIQFMPKTAEGLGTTTTKLAKMSAVEQLDFVEAYFKPFTGKLKTIQDTYMAVLYPKGIGKGENFVLFKKHSVQYKQNKGLDLNGDGKITVGEAAHKVAERLGTAGIANFVELKRGDKGDAVESLQDELIDLGYMTTAQKNTGVGIFGPKTEKFLKAFQKDVLLKDNGIYDLPTHAAFRQINEGIKKGFKGGVVHAIQERLVKNRLMTKAQMNTGVGIFGPKTQTSLIQYQIKNNLEPNGILTDETFRLLFNTAVSALSLEPNGTNQEIDFVLPIRGKGFETYNREPGGADQFGLITTINALISLGLEWNLLHPEVPLQFGDISRRWGGAFKGHKSHKTGRDVDMRPIRKDNRMEAVTVHQDAYDPVKTAEFVKLIRKRIPGISILFNDPQLTKKKWTKTVEGHHNHLHLTFPA